MKITRHLLGVIATKCEIQSELMEVSQKEGKDLARRLGCPFYGVSTQQSKDVDESLESLIEDYGTSCGANRLNEMEERLEKRNLAFQPLQRPNLEASGRKRWWQRLSRR